MGKTIQNTRVADGRVVGYRTDVPSGYEWPWDFWGAVFSGLVRLILVYHSSFFASFRCAILLWKEFNVADVEGAFCYNLII